MILSRHILKQPQVVTLNSNICVLFLGHVFSCFDFHDFHPNMSFWDGLIRQKIPSKTNILRLVYETCCGFWSRTKNMLFWSTSFATPITEKNKFWKKTTGQLLAAPSRVCVFTPPKFNGWNLKMMVSKRNLLFQGLISGSMFNFRGVTHVRCSNLRRWSRVTVLILVGQWSQMVLTDERD